jgi:subtilase family serine protease
MLGRLFVSRRPIRKSTTFRLERLEERATPAVTSSALTPAQVRSAYGFSLAAVNGTSLTGAGETIAIVDAYNDPYIASDLKAFDAKYGIAAPPSLKVVSETGSTTALPQNSSSWSGEIALDVEWAHAIAPGANILLVEANSSNTSDLLSAVNYARNQSGVVAVSMSWGSSEFSGETSYNSYFTTPAGHAGVTFVASSGDNGAGAIWPAVSTNVLAVGGTTLSLSGSNYGSESAWSDSGGGVSKFISKPSYQTAYTGRTRGSPDVSYDANPNTGFAVYNSYDGGWEQVGGTSAGAPQWAALVALADQGRALKGLGSLDGGTQTLPAIYAMPSSDFHDITSGSNGYPAKTGYDLATGRGSPVAQNVISYLVGYGTGTTTSTTTGTTGGTTTTTGSGTTSTGGGTGTTGGGWWGFGWGWGGWWFFAPWSQTAGKPAASPATTAFTVVETPATPSLAVGSTTSAAISATRPTAAPVELPTANTPWWATLQSRAAFADDDFAPISV